MENLQKFNSMENLVPFESLTADQQRRCIELFGDPYKNQPVSRQVPQPTADEIHNTQCCAANPLSFDEGAVPSSIARAHRATAAIARAKSQYGTCNKSAQPRTKQEPIH